MKPHIASSLRIAVGYLIVGIGWILFSDRFLRILVRDPDQWTRWASIKGGLFVAVTAILLFLVLSRAMGHLKSSEQKWKVLFDAAPEAYCLLDPSGVFLDCNPATELLCGYEKRQLIGRNALDFLLPEDRPQAAQLLDLNAHGQTAGPVSCGIKAKDGRLASLEVRSHPVQIQQERSILATIRDVTELTRAGRELARHEAELSTIYDQSPFMTCVVNRQRQVERMNRTMTEFLKVAPVQLPLLPGDLFGCIHAKPGGDSCGHTSGCERCPLPLAIFTTFQTGKTCRDIEARIVSSTDGMEREICLRASTALVNFDDQAKVLLFLEDVTSEKELESQFIQAQKMEAIGQLAGGVAHDFNNILAAMLLHLEFLQMSAGSAVEAASTLKEFELCLNRAASLTRQLLLFGRRQAMEVKKVELGQIIEGLAKMLKRLIGEQIEMSLPVHSSPIWVQADPGMLEQILMNLCINARDAMPRGGKLTLRRSITEVDVEQARHHPEARPGQFACLEVSDTGCGMDATTLKKIFEPFFTTKPAGKGTGLGLATVYGIVRQHQGWIEVDSSVGKGTTFRVFLPLSDEPEPAEASVEPMTIGGCETILLVEDDGNLSGIAKATLTRLGYTVRETSSGPEALLAAKDESLHFDLLLTDMVMPGGLNGLELADGLRKIQPTLSVVITSGYSTALLNQLGEPSVPIRFLAKPYTAATLARTVREVLDRQKNWNS